MDANQLLTKKEIAALSPDQAESYQYAMAHINDENARGPWGGWGRAFEVLQGLGWTKISRQEGPRVFVHLDRPAKVENHFDYRTVL